MDWSDTPEQLQFRVAVRQFIQDRFPESYRPDFHGQQSLEPEGVFGYNWPADRRSHDPERRAAAMEWASDLANKG